LLDFAKLKIKKLATVSSTVTELKLRITLATTQSFPEV